MHACGDRYGLRVWHGAGVPVLGVARQWGAPTPHRRHTKNDMEITGRAAPFEALWRAPLAPALLAELALRPRPIARPRARPATIYPRAATSAYAQTGCQRC